MTDQELAEKIAKLRGWERWHNENIYRHFYVVGAGKKIIFEPTRHHTLKDEVFNDSHFLPMVREAEEKGWIVCWANNRIFFQPDAKPSYDLRTTNSYSIKDYGHMKAMSLAWIEVMDMQRKSGQGNTL